MNTLNFQWNEEKNQKLKVERSICFEDIRQATKDGRLKEIIQNPSLKNFPNQLCLIVEINNYVYVVPFVLQFDGSWFLKTIYPSRKFTKKYL